jgi:hypothetical protein
MATNNSWNSSVSASKGAITLNAGTNQIDISSDAAAATVNLATGAGAKVTTLGSTNGASSLALKYGTADFSLASATGNVMVALDTGEITYPLQSAFLAYLPSNDNDVTGDNTNWRLGSVTALTEVYDQNSDFNTNGTFTAPVTGRYLLGYVVLVAGLASGFLTKFTIITSNREYQNGVNGLNPSSVSQMGFEIYTCADMDAGDTATFYALVQGGTKVADILGNSTLCTYVNGYLIC